LTVADPTFADLVEQARERLVIGCPAVELRDEDEFREPAWQEYIAETMTHLQAQQKEGLPEGLGLDLAVPGAAMLLDEETQERWATLDPSETPDTLRRLAARAVVTHALLRREAEEQMLIALVALELTKPADQRRIHIGTWPPEETGSKVSLAEEVASTARNLGLEKSEASLAALRKVVDGKRASGLPLADWPNLVAAWEKAGRQPSAGGQQ
jgi:hypothetical protein